MKKHEFKNINQFKEFAELLSEALLDCYFEDLAMEVAEYKRNYFGSSSEYYGEFRITLKKILNVHPEILDKSILNDVEEAIEVINKIFS